MSEIHYRCPGCNNTLTVPGSAVGKILPCPTCGQKAVVPVGLPPEPASDSFDFSRERSQIREPEPWYFGMASLYAWLIVAFNFIGFALGTAYVLRAIWVAMAFGREWLIVFIVGYFLLLIWVFLGVLFLAALIFLFVDIARSLRILKQRRNE